MAFTLRQNFSFTLMGNVFFAACQWGILMMLAKLGTPETVGQFALGVAVTGPFFMFSYLGLRAIQVADKENNYSFGHYLGCRFGAATLSQLIVVIIISFGFYRKEVAIVILLIGLSKLFESISDIIYGFFQKHEQMDVIAKSLFLRGIFSLISMTLAVYLTHNLIFGVLMLALVGATVLFSYDIKKCFLELKGNVLISNHKTDDILYNVLKTEIMQWQILKKLMWLAMPLGFVAMLISFRSNIPRYFIESFLGEKELGIFAAISYINVAGITIISALGQSASPRLVHYFHKKDIKAFYSLLFKLIGFGAMIGCSSILLAHLAGKEILSLLYKPEYAAYSEVFTLLMVAGGVGYIASFLNDTMNCVQQFKLQLPLFIFINFVTILCCFWLVPRHGMKGAAIAITMGMLVQAAGAGIIITFAMKRLT